jgi:hypothetical protein
MKPLNYDRSTCSPVSSNCVIWQGPDIECINLCKGDTITDVVYKMATELCEITEQLNLKQIDLKCFADGICPPSTFRQFIQLLVDKICKIQGCLPDCFDACPPCTPNTPAAARVMAVTPMASTTGDTVVTVAEPFYYVNQYGDTVTTMTVTEYAVAIGNKVATHISQIAAIQQALVSQSQRITVLENAPAPTLELPTIIPTGILPKTATAIDDVLSVLEAQFVQLRNATGTPNEIYTNIQKQPSINSANSLANPSATMSSLPGWSSTVTNEAASVGNIWIAINDIRVAVQNLIATYLPSECNNISLVINASFSENVVTLYITGNVPSYFNNTIPTGTPFRFEDTLGNSYVININILSIINNPSGFQVDLTNTSINKASNITITAEPSFTSTNTGSECQSILLYTIINQAACPSVTYVPTSSTIGFSFNSESGSRIYTVNLYTQLSEEPIASQTITTNEVTTVTGTFSDLTSNTAYTARVIVVVNGIETTCELTAITTLNLLG